MPHLADQSATSAGVSLQYGSRTDVGHKRNENEDSLLAASPVFLVADGMGGLEAGHRASAAVIASSRPPSPTPAYWPATWSPQWSAPNARCGSCRIRPGAAPAAP